MDKTNTIRLLTVDDHPVMLEGLAAIINRQTDMRVVAEAENGQVAIEQFRAHRPDVTLMDLRLPLVSGVDALKSILKEFPGSRVIVLTNFDGDEDIYRALRAGARAYLLKGMLCDELLEAIRVVHAGRYKFPPAIAERMAARMSVPDLTKREIEVLRLIVKGKSNKEIANTLCIAEGTVKGHVNNIFSKLGVADRTHAATTAIRRGIIYFQGS